MTGASKLQEPIDTEKLRLVQADPAFQKSLTEYVGDPVKDLALTDEEKQQLDIPLYSLSDIFPDFKKHFRPLKTVTQEVRLTALCGSVERTFDRFKFDFTPADPADVEVTDLADKLKAGQLETKDNPLIVHAIPFRDKYEGFVAEGAALVAAHKVSQKESLWAKVTFYKKIGR